MLFNAFEKLDYYLLSISNGECRGFFAIFLGFVYNTDLITIFIISSYKVIPQNTQKTLTIKKNPVQTSPHQIAKI